MPTVRLLSGRATTSANDRGGRAATGTAAAERLLGQGDGRPPSPGRMVGTVPVVTADLPDPHPNAPAVGSVLPSHYPYCYGCGSEHPSGLHLRIVVGPGLTMHGTFAFGEDHQGAPGLVHGGLVAAAFDELLGALNWLLLKPAVTGRLEVDFRKPIPVGTTVSLQGRVRSVEGRKVWTEGTGTFDDGTMAAQAAGLFITVPAEHFVEHGRRTGPSPLLQQLSSGLDLSP